MSKTKPDEQEQVQDATPLQVIDERLYRIESTLRTLEERSAPPEPLEPSTDRPKRVSRPHSEAEMRKALACSTGVKQFQDDDDPIEILADAIDELLELRAIREKIARQTLQWQTELRR